MREIRYVSGGWSLFIDGVKTGAPLTDTDIRWDEANKVILDSNVPANIRVNARGGTDTYIVRPTLAQSITIADALVNTGEFNLIKFDDGVVATSVALTAGKIIITFGSAKTITVGELATTQFQVGDGAVQTDTQFVAAHAAGFTADENDAPMVTISGAQSLGIFENINPPAAATGFSVSATDADDNNVTFTIDDARFEFTGAGATKEIHVKANQLFDFETDNGKKITITGTDDGIGAKTHTQQFTLTVRDINETPQLVRSTLAANASETVVLDSTDLLVTDADAADTPANLTYTVTDATAATGVLEKLSAGSWAILVNADTFTQADVNDGNIRFVANVGTNIGDPAFSFTVADGGENAVQPVGVTLATGIRTVQTVANEASANNVDIATQTAAKIIDTGDGKDVIIAGKGNDLIDAGLGDDKVDLSAGGANIIIYDFGAGGLALDGGDKITGFKRGEDKLIFREATQSSSTATTLAEFFTNARGANLNILNDDYFIVTPDYVKDAGAFFITGITFNFQDSGAYDSNKISSGLLAVIFETRIAWADFVTLIGGLDAMDIDLFALKDPATITDILGEDSFDFQQIVTAATDTPTTGTVMIDYADIFSNNTPNIGETLTANTSGLADTDDDTLTFTYQWKLGGTDIIGATSATHLAALGIYTVTVIARDSTNNVQTTFTAPMLTVVEKLSPASPMITTASNISAIVKEDIPDSTNATGTIIATDVNKDTLTYHGVFKTTQHAALNKIGRFTIDANTGVWNYKLNGNDLNLNVAWDTLGNTDNFDTGDNLSVIYTVSVSDGLASVTQDVTITVNGITDVNGDGTANVLDSSSSTVAQIIQGGAAADTITSGSGGDVIAGGTGVDTLRVGSGADTVIHRFSSGGTALVNTDGADTIHSFHRGTDKFVFVDTDTASPITDLASFAAGLESSGSEVRVTILGDLGNSYSNRIHKLEIKFGSTGDFLTVNFNGTGNSGKLSLFSDVSSKFEPSTTLVKALTDFSILESLLGTGSIEFVPELDLGIILVPSTNRAPIGTVLLTGTAEQGGVLTADASGLDDADGLGSGGFTYTWLRDSAVISGATATTYTLVQADISKFISVRAHYTDGSGQAQSVTSAPTAAVIDVDVVASAINFINVQALPENITEHTKVADIVVTDEDGGFEYNALSGTDAALFKILRNALYLKANPPTPLDFETKPTLEVTVSIKDTTVSATLNVAVTNIDDVPTALTLTPKITELAEDANVAAYIWVGELIVADVDGGFGFTLSGDDEALFEVSGNRLYLKKTATLDYETNPVLDVRVTITGTNLRQDLSLGVTDAEEGDAVYGVTGDLQVGSVLTAAQTTPDPDGVTGAMNYQWQSKTGTGVWVDISGATATTYKLTAAEATKQIRTKVTYRDDFGADETVYGTIRGVVSEVISEDIPSLTSVSGVIAGFPQFSEFFSTNQNSALARIGEFTIDLNTGAWRYLLNGDDAKLNAAWNALGNAGNFDSSDSLTVTYTVRTTTGAVTTNQDVPIIIRGITDIIGDGGVGDYTDGYRYSTVSQYFNTGDGFDGITAGRAGDVIAGGTGADLIRLGAGDDVIIQRFASSGTSWTQTDSSDTILNFTRGADKLLLMDVDTDTPITNLTDFLTAVPSSGGQIIAQVKSGQIVAVSFKLPNGGSVDALFALRGFEGKTLKINFNTDGPLQTFSDHSSKFTNNVLTDYSFLDDLFGAGGLDVVAAADLGVVII